ncbi:hypothetical protein ACKUVQ_13745 [Mycobacterium seoulense]|uniref:hypothetical protein n=1 Tax=Mycobacterium seoulense TaxID=386911 RepID=UPI003CF1576D
MLNGKHSSSSFNEHAEAVRFQGLANRTSPAKALEVWATQTPGAERDERGDKTPSGSRRAQGTALSDLP